MPYFARDVFKEPWGNNSVVGKTMCSGKSYALGVVPSLNSVQGTKDYDNSNKDSSSQVIKEWFTE